MPSKKQQYNLVQQDEYDTRIPMHSEEAFQHGITFQAKTRQKKKKKEKNKKEEEEEEEEEEEKKKKKEERKKKKKREKMVHVPCDIKLDYLPIYLPM
ncbi:hypothetical protein M8J77_021091 [Diaphorina citri]|nr:hypothetical protein M8J77_021091 [Diaphorina citri]